VNTSCQTILNSDYQNGHGPSYVKLRHLGSDISSSYRNSDSIDNCINLQNTSIDTHRRSLAHQATTDRQSKSKAVQYKNKRGFTILNSKLKKGNHSGLADRMKKWLNTSNGGAESATLLHLNKGNTNITGNINSNDKPRVIKSKCFSQLDLVNKDKSLLHTCNNNATQDGIAHISESNTNNIFIPKKITVTSSTQTVQSDINDKVNLPSTRAKSLFVIPEAKITESTVNSKGTLTNGGPLANTILESVPKRNANISTGLVSHVATSITKNNRRMLRGKLIALFNNVFKLAKTGAHIVFNDYHRYLGITPKYIDRSIEIKMEMFHTPKMTEIKKDLRQETFLQCRLNLLDSYAKLKRENFSLINNIQDYLDKYIQGDNKSELVSDFMRRVIASMNQIKIGTCHLQHKKHTKKANYLICNSPHMCKTNKIWIKEKDSNGLIATGDPTKTVNYCNKNHYCPTIYDYINPTATKTWDLGYSDKETLVMSKENEIDNFDYSIEKINWNVDDWSNLLQNFSSRHPIPPTGNNDKILDDFERDWARMLYGARWKHIIDNMPKDKKPMDKIVTPFECPFIRLPDPMSREKEKSLECTKNEIKKKLTLPNKELGNINTWKRLKAFLKEKDMLIVSTDKTKKQVLMPRSKLNALGEKFLQNNPDYKPLKNSKADSIMKDANTIMRKLLKEANLSPREASKLIVKNAKGAQMTFLIKDHKEADENGDLPSRPIASIHNTPVDKLDFILQYILAQTAKLVPTNLLNVETALKKIDELNQNTPSEGKKWALMSLDVKSLYPSIPIKKGIDEIIKFLAEKIDDVDTLGISIDNIRIALEFVCTNYEVEFNNKSYLQTNGIPMGARFAPPFAIIYMAAVEITAIRNLENAGYQIEYYTRYIDDTLMIMQINKEETVSKDEVLSIFNEVTPEIQFTIEMPTDTERMPFLDVELYTEDNKIQYGWYMKTLHSGNLMRKDAYAPQKVKDNFIINSFFRIFTRCNNVKDKELATNKMYKLLIKNLYNNIEVNRGLKRAVHKFNNFIEKEPWKLEQAILKTQFLSDIMNFDLKGRLLNHNIKLVNKKFIRLTSLNPREKINSTCTCDICKQIGDKYNCKTQKVVYAYKCLGCQEFYIGKTINTIVSRHKQHKAAIKKDDKQKSALADHMGSCKFAHDNGICAFQISILDKCRDNTDCLIQESRLINKLNPKMNRKNELNEKDF
jgi:hypothetical protein